MKKVVLFLVFALVFSGLGFMPLQAEAQSPMEGCTIVRDIEVGQPGDDGYISVSQGDSIGPEHQSDPQEGWAFLCMINIANRLATMLFYAMIALVVALVILGGFFILTSGGAEEKVTQGKKYITFAIIGVIVAVFAYAVPALINFIV